jgi:hypothetical protein
MTQPESFGHEPILGDDHVIVIVPREFSAQTVRGLERIDGESAALATILRALS